MPMCSTVPFSSPITRKSPTLNGLSSAIDSEASRSPSTFCTARAMAMPPTPRPAISAVMSMPRLASSSRKARTQIAVTPTNLRMLRDAEPSLASRASSSRRCSTKNRTVAVPHMATCSHTKNSSTPVMYLSAFSGTSSQRSARKLATTIRKIRVVRFSSAMTSSSGAADLSGDSFLRRPVTKRFTMGSTVNHSANCRAALIQAARSLPRNTCWPSSSSSFMLNPVVRAHRKRQASDFPYCSRCGCQLRVEPLEQPINSPAGRGVRPPSRFRHLVKPEGAGFCYLLSQLH